MSLLFLLYPFLLQSDRSVHYLAQSCLYLQPALCFHPFKCFPYCRAMFHLVPVFLCGCGALCICVCILCHVTLNKPHTFSGNVRKNKASHKTGENSVSPIDLRCCFSIWSVHISSFTEKSDRMVKGWKDGE